MRWILRCALMVWGVCILALATAVWFGSGLPAPKYLETLHLSDCRPPCWIGIMPGKTTIQEAKQLVFSAYRDFNVSQDGDWYRLDLKNEAENTELGIDFNDGGGQETDIVYSVILATIRVHGTALSYGNLYSILGAPDSVMVSGLTVPRLFYNRPGIQIGISNSIRALC